MEARPGCPRPGPGQRFGQGAGSPRAGRASRFSQFSLAPRPPKARGERAPGLPRPLARGTEAEPGTGAAPPAALRSAAAFPEDAWSLSRVGAGWEQGRPRCPRKCPSAARGGFVRLQRLPSASRSAPGSAPTFPSRPFGPALPTPPIQSPSEAFPCKFPTRRRRPPRGASSADSQPPSHTKAGCKQNTTNRAPELRALRSGRGLASDAGGVPASTKTSAGSGPRWDPARSGGRGPAPPPPLHHMHARSGRALRISACIAGITEPRPPPPRVPEPCSHTLLPRLFQRGQRGEGAAPSGEQLSVRGAAEPGDARGERDGRGLSGRARPGPPRAAAAATRPAWRWPGPSATGSAGGRAGAP